MNGEFVFLNTDDLFYGEIYLRIERLDAADD